MTKKQDNIETITINDVEYVKKSDIKDKTPAEKLDGMEYKIVRTYSAGVFAGYIKERNGKEVTMLKARRLWYWDGAASLSQLAMEGVKKPENCKFPCEVDRLVLTEVVEILDATKQAKQSIDEVEVWEK